MPPHQVNTMKPTTVFSLIAIPSLAKMAIALPISRIESKVRGDSSAESTANSAVRILTICSAIGYLSMAYLASASWVWRLTRVHFFIASISIAASVAANGVFSALETGNLANMIVPLSCAVLGAILILLSVMYRGCKLAAEKLIAEAALLELGYPAPFIEFLTLKDLSEGVFISLERDPSRACPTLLATEALKWKLGDKKRAVELLSLIFVQPISQEAMKIRGRILSDKRKKIPELKGRPKDAINELQIIISELLDL